MAGPVSDKRVAERQIDISRRSSQPRHDPSHLEPQPTTEAVGSGSRPLIDARAPETPPLNSLPVISPLMAWRESSRAKGVRNRDRWESPT